MIRPNARASERSHLRTHSSFTDHTNFTFLIPPKCTVIIAKCLASPADRPRWNIIMEKKMNGNLLFIKIYYENIRGWFAFHLVWLGMAWYGLAWLGMALEWSPQGLSFTTPMPLPMTISARQRQHDRKKARARFLKPSTLKQIDWAFDWNCKATDNIFLRIIY